MNYKAIVIVNGREYTLFLPHTLELETAADALEFVRDEIRGYGVFSNGTTEALEINCRDTAYESIKVLQCADVPQPVLDPGVQAPEEAPDLNKEYEVVNLTSHFLGQPMDVSLLVYYAGTRVVVMPTMINGATAYNYMSEANIVEFTHKLAQESLGLQRSSYNILLYPGPLLDLDDGVEYVRDWLNANEPAYVPKNKNAKAFFGWNERL